MKSERTKKDSVRMLSRLAIISLSGLALLSAGCTTEDRIGGQATGIGALIGAGAGALLAGDGDRGKGAAIGALLGGAGGAAVGNKQKANYRAEKAHTDALAAQVAGVEKYNAEIAAYNEKLKEEIAAIEAEKDAARRLARAKAKRIEVSRKQAEVNRKINAVRQMPAYQAKDAQISTLVLKEQKLQGAVNRLKKMERNSGG